MSHRDKWNQEHFTNNSKLAKRAEMKNIYSELLIVSLDELLFQIWIA